MKTIWLPVLLATALAAAAVPRDLPEPTPEKLPPWRGFNLLEKFNAGHAGPFREEDFALISELGFNFVRLPMDYRCWIKDKDWKRINDEALAEIAQAVELGRKHGVHVCLNFHRAPGYTVARPPEPKSIWTDDEALEVCAMHWAHFAKRFKGVPNRHLSFDLMNEPADVKPEDYARVAGALVRAIRGEDPGRLVIADGRAWGTKPCPELAGLRIAQMTRGYTPFHLTHYMASWANGEGFPRPTWPVLQAHGIIYGPAKKPLDVPLVLEGRLPEGTLRLRVHEVSGHDTLIVRGDGAKLWERKFTPGKEDADCKNVDRKKTWAFGTYDHDYSIPLRPGLRRIEILVGEGDWLSLSEIAIAKEGSRECVLPLAADWGKTNGVIPFAGTEAAVPFQVPPVYDAARLWTEMIEPWQALQKQGVGVMVGEWGAYNRTPREVTLRWMEDCLKNWKQAGWGWALWNFRGSFGPLDSGRSDVTYEDFHGHKLDRAMMNLLQKY